MSTAGKPPRKVKGATMLDTLEREAIHTFLVAKDDASIGKIDIKDFKCIGSYNWQNNEAPTILVPGSPRIWQTARTQIPFTVPHDVGFHMVDHNGFYLPSMPLLPILLAVPPSFDFSLVHFVLDRNGLRKLLSWVKGQKEEFRLDCELVGNTVLCSRWEERPRMAANRESYGMGLVNQLTDFAPGCESSAEGNHRIVSYDLGGVKLVVRFEVDGCIPVTTALEKVTLDPPSSPPSAAPITVIAAGAPVSDASIIEISSKKKGVSTSWRKRYEQMFFAQTSTVYVGQHEKGTFTSLTRKTMAELDYVKDNMQPQLRQLCRSMDDIRAFLMSLKDGGQENARVSLICKDNDLKVHRRTNDGKCLPPEHLARFVA